MYCKAFGLSGMHWAAAWLLLWSDGHKLWHCLVVLQSTVLDYQEPSHPLPSCCASWWSEMFMFLPFLILARNVVKSTSEFSRQVPAQRRSSISTPATTSLDLRSAFTTAIGAHTHNATPPESRTALSAPDPITSCPPTTPLRVLRPPRLPPLRARQRVLWRTPTTT